MTPAGQRRFATARAAHESATNQGVKSFVVIKNGRALEFAWVAPVEFFMSRALEAAAAGIRVMEVVQ